MTKRLKIIVAEDNDIQREFLAYLINSLGYEALQAADGQIALDLVVDTDAQILISDFQMPNLNGIELTRAVRELDLDHYVHVILITGSDEDDLRREALIAGADDFLTKGRSPVMLKARIRAATRLINHAMELAQKTRVLKETNEQIQQDLKAAANAQRQLLPEIHDKILGYRVSSAFMPSSFVSGDMFGCFALSDTQLGFYAVDVSGHGIHASLLSVAIGHLITPEFFKSTVFRNDQTPDPAALVANLNLRFSRSENDDYFTMFCGIFDKETGRLDYCQAGSPSPFYVDPLGKTTLVGDGGFPVGMFQEASYDNASMDIAYGGTLIVCSDAAIEAENIDFEPFGTDRIADIVATCPQVGSQTIPDTIIAALSVWRDDVALEDDLTIVALERTYP